MTMIYRRFGKTELQMPVFSCGGMRYQHKWQDMPLKDIPAENQDNLEKTILKSIESGINHIETARGYGSSERQLGQILPSLPRKEIIVQTKIGPTEKSEDFLRNFQDSLNRLRLDYVDLLAIHGINNQETLDWSVNKGGCLDIARKLQKDGLARHIGFSSHGPTDIIQAAINTDYPGGFDYVNLHWYYINQHNWPAIVDATHKDMGVFIISPSDKGGLLYKPTPQLIKLTEPLHPIVFNDIFCLNHPQVHTLSIGAVRPSDFDLHLESLKYLDEAKELLPPIIHKLESRIEEVFGKEFAHRYEEGLPEWESVQDQINIKVILWLYILAKSYGMVEYGQMRYNLLGNGGHWFPGQNASNIHSANIQSALLQSPFKMDIPRMLEEAHQLLFKKPVKRLSES